MPRSATVHALKARTATQGEFFENLRIFLTGALTPDVDEERLMAASDYLQARVARVESCAALNTLDLTLTDGALVEVTVSTPEPAALVG